MREGQLSQSFPTLSTQGCHLAAAFSNLGSPSKPRPKSQPAKGLLPRSNGLGLRHRPRRAGAAGVGAGGDGAVADGEGGAVALAQLAEEGDVAWMVA